MLVDSVFSPILRFSEEPLIPISEIERSQDVIQQDIVEALTEALEDETQRWLERMDDALADLDAAAINRSQWPLASRMRSIIFRLWAEGFELGGRQGIEEMQAATADVREFSRVRRFAVPLDIQRDIEAIFDLEPPQLINTDAVEAVIGRANLLAGDFADDTFLDLRKHLVAAIVPQSDTGEPIGRDVLLERIQKTLQVSEARANNIARTELTYAYNNGRLNSFNESPLVDYLRFLAISDDRTTDICQSRDGMLIPKNDVALVELNTPPLHYQCRSTLTAVMSRLSRFKDLVEDSTRVPANRDLAPLPPGWRTGEAQTPSVTQHPEYPEIAFESFEDVDFRTLLEVASGVSGTTYIDIANNRIIKVGKIRGEQVLKNPLTGENYTLQLDDVGNTIKANQIGLGAEMLSAGSIDENGWGTYAMRIAPGDPVESVIEEIGEDRSPENLGVARSLGREMIRQIEVLHDAGATHRDLHDENVFYDVDTGELTIIDWGAANFDGKGPEFISDYDILGDIAYAINDNGLEDAFEELENVPEELTEQAAAQFIQKAKEFFAED